MFTARQSITSYGANNIFTGLQGKANFNIPKEKLEFLVEELFSISSLLVVLTSFYPSYPKSHKL